jgi:general secretion pathway protein G
MQRTPGVAAWNGPYLKGNTLPNDPWNHPYMYRAPGQHGPYEIISYGADGQEGGSGIAADISTENLVNAKNE